jgi:hypothetical protein
MRAVRAAIIVVAERADSQPDLPERLFGSAAGHRRE